MNSHNAVQKIYTSLYINIILRIVSDPFCSIVRAKTPVDHFKFFSTFLHDCVAKQKYTVSIFATGSLFFSQLRKLFSSNRRNTFLLPNGPFESFPKIYKKFSRGYQCFKLPTMLRALRPRILFSLCTLKLPN